eukprot:XP_011682378.1 PREDICTED: ankyrin repeat domain-containing protein 50-like [Strongylocentrotus purpuratus]
MNRFNRAEVCEADIRRADEDRSPLHAASADGHYDVVRAIIFQGADLNSVDICGRTPLHVASSNGHLRVVQFLTIHGADRDRADSDGRTPLHMASSNGADLNRADNDGRTPVHAASSNDHRNVVQALIGQRADLNRADNDGRTPLHAASSNGHRNCLQALIGQRADLNRADNDGRPPPHAASSNGHCDVVQALIGQRADLNWADNDGWAPIHVASFNGHLDVVHVLIGHRADLNRNNNDGRKSFQAASSNGHHDVLQILIGQESDPNRANNDGMPPLCTQLIDNGRYPIAVITNVDRASDEDLDNMHLVLGSTGITDIYKVANITPDKEHLEDEYQLSLLRMIENCMEDGDRIYELRTQIEEDYSGSLDIQHGLDEVNQELQHVEKQIERLLKQHGSCQSKEQLEVQTSRLHELSLQTGSTDWEKSARPSFPAMRPHLVLDPHKLVICIHQNQECYRKEDLVSVVQAIFVGWLLDSNVFDIQGPNGMD